MTIVTFILASEITTTEGKINVRRISNFNTLYYFYVLIFSLLLQFCVSFQLQRSLLQKVTLMLTVFEISILCFILILCWYVLSLWGARWPHGWCARLRSERSGFEPWPGTLCCVLGQDALLSQCLSPPRCINGYRRT